MSILANITVYTCDDCHAIVTVQTGQEVESHYVDWFGGLSKDFCPDCRRRLHNQAAIAAEEAVRDLVLRQVKSAAVSRHEIIEENNNVIN